jgi:hypothetical protein
MYLTVPIPVTKSFVRRVYFKAADPRKTAQVVRLSPARLPALELICSPSSRISQLDISLKMDAPFSVLKQKVSRLVGVPANKVSTLHVEFIIIIESDPTYRCPRSS